MVQVWAPQSGGASSSSLRLSAVTALLPLRARDDELQAISTLLAKASPQLVLLSGQRRVGKTFLVQHILDRLDRGILPLYFEATQAGPAAELARFHRQLTGAVRAGLLPPAPPPATWEQALGLAAFVARHQPLVVAIDEATYLMASTPSFASEVQAVWDSLVSQADPPRLSIILTGSAVGMVDAVLSAGGALHQRPTLAKRINPLTPAEAYRFTGQPDPVRLLEAWAACGGYPLHLDRWHWSEDTQTNLQRLAGTPGGVLVEDGGLVLANLSDAGRRVLLAVGQGRTKVSEIANEVGTRPERPLEQLRQARLVVDARPLGAPLKARPQYRVADSYLRFWFRVLGNHVQQIEAGQGPAVLRHTAGAWQEHLGWAFEVAARHHAVTLERSGALPAGTLVDEWWTVTGEQAQLDVLGLLDHRTVAVGEARWQRRPLDQRDLEELTAKLRLVPRPIPQPSLLLWGRGGVRPEVQVGRVLGFGPADMLAL